MIAIVGGSGSAPPAVTLITPASGSTMDPRPNFGGLAGTAPDDRRTVRVSVYRGMEARGRPIETFETRRGTGGAFSVLAPTPLEPGTYTARARQYDSTGDAGESAPRTFSVRPAGAPVLLAAGDIATCSTPGDEQTAEILDHLPGEVVPLGDTVYEFGTPAEYSRCYAPTWGRHLARSRPIVGDHEYERSDTAEGFFDYFGPAARGLADGHYAYGLGDWRVIGFNSYCYETGSCKKETDRWLSRELAAHPAPCTVALYHEPLFSSGDIHGNNPNARPLWEQMYGAGVDIVLSGSEHIYERFAPQTPTGEADPERGIRQFTVGTGGYYRYRVKKPQPNSEVREDGTWGILRLALEPGSYRWRFIPVEGSEFTDSGRARCH